MKKLLALLMLCGGCASSPSAPPPKKDDAPPPPTKHEFDVTFETPGEWKKEAPASNMRKAQYAVPDKDKAEGDATFVYFGPMGGGVEGNQDRWRTQFQNQPADPKTEEFKVGALTIHLLDIAGEYASDAGADPKPDQRGLFAIVETGNGDHVFRLTGPRGTVGDWRDAFVDMLKKIKSRGA